ncbi:MAG: hypothetical protein BroJett011_02330 [Chloroflexota bacterium]|nr:MAG: hypothetical protein BroJett011_02330 [Chloroflexota bacterium]
MSSNILISLRPENVIRQLPWRVDSKAALGFLLLLATFSLVGWLYLTQASAVTATSYRMDQLRLELDQIKNQNAALTLEIARLEALDRIESRARELGFAPTTNVRYLPVANYPMPLEPEKPAWGAGPLRSDLEEAQAEFDPAAWWTETLDNFAAWLEGRE